MCGFAGFVGPRDPVLLDRMGERVRHRGPDQEGVFADDGCSLAHKRLSIIDLSEAGRQPLTSTDGRFVVAYNGEIYNYRELRERYRLLGWRFRTNTDTECLIASAALNGLKDLEDFHGMFSFALWDTKEGVCYVARDRMGIKPLYVAEVGDRIAFGSEIPSLLPLKEKWSLDTEARAMYLTVGYVPGPRTMFQGIRSLEPGRLFSVRNREGLKEIHRFEGFSAAPKAHSFTEAASVLRETTDRIVADQMVSDRPVGLFLSGGLDSTVVLSAMRAAKPGAVLKTFTTRFQHESGDPKFNRDADLARATAERYGCEHAEIEVSPEDVIRESAAIAHHLGQPHANHSVPALDAAARLASKEVPVILSGDGGDESFGGYERYRLFAASAAVLGNTPLRAITRTLSRLHPRGKSWGDLLGASDEASRLLTFHATSRARRKALFGAGMNDAPLVSLWQERLSEVSATDPVSRFMALDRAGWLRDDAFVRSDRVTMRHGLELRVPLTDDTLVAFAASLPRSFHVTPFETKKLWRAAFADRVSPDVASGEKRGWFPPTAKWFRTGLKDWLNDLVEEAITTHAWMNGDAIRLAIQLHEQGSVYALQELQTIIGYQLWWREYGGVIENV